MTKFIKIQNIECVREEKERKAILRNSFNTFLNLRRRIKNQHQPKKEACPSRFAY
jgi:hypothetical protein